MKILRGLETAVLVLLLSTMLGLSAYQVIARNLFDGGILWGDAAVRVLVLWGALLGAMVAARSDEHIRVDLINRYLGEQAQRHMRRVTSAFTAAICGVVAYFSAVFVIDERSFGDVAFNATFGPIEVLGVPELDIDVMAWVCQLIMPVGMGLIALRYLGHTISPPDPVLPIPLNDQDDQQRSPQDEP